MGVAKSRRCAKRVRAGGAGRRIARRHHGIWTGLPRLIRYRLIVPLKRSRHAPEHLARGSLIGLIWAFTPSIGVRMSLVVLT